MSGSNEFVYKDRNSKKQDADLHGPILEQGDHHAAQNIGKEVARQCGLTEAEIMRLYANT